MSAIKSVAIVDDDSQARSNYSDFIEDKEWEPYLVDELPPSVSEAVELLQVNADALLCDYQLNKYSYSTFNGDVLIASAYTRNIPSVLCTAYKDYPFTMRRDLRRNIPIVLDVKELDPDRIATAFEVCQREYKNDFLKERKPWRALVRIDEVDEDSGYCHVIIPAWDSVSKIGVYMTDFPDDIRNNIVPGYRFHAAVNLGAEDSRDIYFGEWETD